MDRETKIDCSVELYEWSENNLQTDLTLDDCVKIVMWCEGKEIGTSEKDLRVCEVITSAWISVKERLPKQMKDCIFKLNNGNTAIGKCNYFEFGDSELVEVYGKGLSYLCHTYRNWELHNFDRTEFYEVTHWMYLADAPN